MKQGEILAGRFRLERELGQGAVGRVWLALDVQMQDDKVALKILNEHLADSHKSVSALKREILLTRRLRHPNILSVNTFWESDGLYFISMEYIDGRSLAEALAERDEAFTVREVLPWFEQLASALDFAHGEGLLHRDVKPANILLEQPRAESSRRSTSSVHLSDFGIAQTAEEVNRGAESEGFTTSGTILFMSPEQLLARPLDGRSDQYSLACTLHQLLTGHPPFHAGTVVEQILSKPPKPIECLALEANKALLRALAKRADERYPTCNDFYRSFAEAVAQHMEAVGAIEYRQPKLGGERKTSSKSETVRLTPYDPDQSRRRLGWVLVEAGLITKEQLDEALLKHGGSRDKLGSVLVSLGYVQEDALMRTLAEQLHLPMVDLARERFDPDVRDITTAALAEQRRCIPICRDGDRLLVAMADPLDMNAMNEIESACGMHVEPCLARESDIMDAIRQVFGSEDKRFDLEL